MADETGEPDVRVKDRRRFTSEGEAREGAGEPPRPEPNTSPAADSVSGGAEAQPEQPPFPETPVGGMHAPPASFEVLVLSLAMQVQMELGAGPSAEGEVPNLDVARHTIDLLSVLQEKTKGNLTLEEQRLLDNTVTELRFRYVQAVGEINKKAQG